MPTLYRVKATYLDQYAELVTQVNERSVTLHGQPMTRSIVSSANRPGREIVIQPASQEDLKFLFNEGHPFIEAYEAESDLSQSEARKTKSEAKSDVQ